DQYQRVLRRDRRVVGADTHRIEAVHPDEVGIEGQRREIRCLHPADREVEAAVGDAGGLCMRREDPGVDAQLRHPGGPFRPVRWTPVHVTDPHRLRCHKAGRSPPHLVCLTHQCASVRQQRRAAGGEGDGPAVAVEEADLQVAFESLDLLGQRRTRDVQPLGRTTEVQLLGDGHEVAQLAQLHPASVVQCEAAPINREQAGHTGGAWSVAEPALQRASTRRRDQTMNNSQRVAIITGASQGIGEGLVTAYRKLGYAVVANSRSIAESDDPMVVTVPGDIGLPGVGQRIVDAAMRRFGRVDTVVNNAGIFIPKPFTEYTDDDYDAIPAVNLRGFFELSRAAVAAMLSRQGGGHIVNISTSLVDHANSQVPSALASLTKGGLNAVTKALAVEYAGRGIRSNAVALGVIRTPMHDAASY